MSRGQAEQRIEGTTRGGPGEGAQSLPGERGTAWLLPMYVPPPSFTWGLGPAREGPEFPIGRGAASGLQQVQVCPLPSEGWVEGQYPKSRQRW